MLRLRKGLRISSMDIPVMQDELIPWLLENEIMTTTYREMLVERSVMK